MDYEQEKELEQVLAELKVYDRALLAFRLVD